MDQAGPDSLVAVLGAVASLMAMFVYLDESGDTGFRFKHGSTRYFVVTLLLVDDPIPIQASIDELRRELGYPPEKEFRFVNTRPEVRYLFLRRLVRHQFTIRALVVDKLLMTRPHMRNRDTFYNYLVQLILRHDQGTIREARLVVDESVKSRKRQDYLAAYLRRNLNTQGGETRITKVHHHGSHTDNLLQAVDMVSGAIYAAYRRNDDSYLRIVKPKFGKPTGDLWVWLPYQAQ